MPYMLGKLPKRHDHRTLKLANYLTAELPAPPPSVDWGSDVTDWTMLLNNSIGDCTCASAGHMIQQWARVAKGVDFVPADQQILQAYEAITGYDPSDPSTDQGANELDVLKFWRQNGIAGHKIDAFASVNVANQTEVKQCIALFGNVYLGVLLPISAQGQSAWNVPPGGLTGDGAPGSWGGHAIPAVAYDDAGLTVITWGAPLKMSWDFFAAYCEEAYAVLSADWIEANGNAPSGFNLSALQADLAAL